MSANSDSAREPAAGKPAPRADQRRRLALVVGALGVVYGDIGTSPLYALRECFTVRHGVAPSPANVCGIISLIFWSLVLIVSVKYIVWVMRANNKGEGGILALLALVVPEREDGRGRAAGGLMVLGVVGAALLYGDGMITPALTVLSAVEGLGVATPVFQPYVVPLAVVVLVTLFSVQRFGTAQVGKVFGPVMLVWFLTLAVLGLRGIMMAPRVLQGLSPHHAVLFLAHNGRLAFVVLGSVFLAVTGAEALYADMGHFGAGPIRRAWFAVAFPSLVLNYLGEGALLLLDPQAAKNPFYLLAPSWAMPFLIALATLAAVIASQSMISGTYSLTMQAIQMGYLPRLIIRHTSHSERGQIYMPQVNRFLLVTCVGLVLGFQSSGRLAGAYGIAVSLTMLITTILFFSAARRLWDWSLGRALLVCAGFVGVETSFVLANGLKIWHGGWFPLVMGLFIFSLMTTWRTGRQFLRVRLSEVFLPLGLFLKDYDNLKVHRVEGTAVFLSGHPGSTPISLLHNLRHNKVLHERVVILTVINQDIPFAAESDRVRVEHLRPDIYRVVGRYGFMEQPNVPELLRACATKGLELDDMQTTFFLSRETIIPGKGPGMAQWRRRLFATLSRNAQAATAFFGLPPNRVVELGMQVEV
jgi:KUP system potassium uptake protein